MSTITNTIGEPRSYDLHEGRGSDASSVNDEHSGGSCDSHQDDLVHIFRDSSIAPESKSTRGRSRERSDNRRRMTDGKVDHDEGEERMLRAKFEVEALYAEIYQLKRDNEELWRIWERVRQTSPAQGSGYDASMMHLERSSGALTATSLHDSGP